MTLASLLAALELPADATFQAARARYKILAKSAHPDVPGGCADKMRRLNTLWEQIAAQLRPDAQDTPQDTIRFPDTYFPLSATLLDTLVESTHDRIIVDALTDYLQRIAFITQGLDGPWAPDILHTIAPVRLTFQTPRRIALGPQFQDVACSVPNLPHHTHILLVPSVSLKNARTIQTHGPIRALNDIPHHAGGQPVIFPTKKDQLRVFITSETTPWRYAVFDSTDPAKLRRAARVLPQYAPLITRIANHLEKYPMP